MIWLARDEDRAACALLPDQNSAAGGLLALSLSRPIHRLRHEDDTFQQ